MSKSARVTQNSSSVINTIYNARNNLLTQLGSRGYSIDEHSGCSVSEVNSMHQNDQLDMLMTAEISAERPIATKIYVKFFMGKKLAASNVQEIVDDLFVFEDQVLKKEDALLVVSKDEPNEALINYQKHTWERHGIFITIICVQRLQFNILNHEYVPPHRAMTAGEMENTKKKFNVMNNDQFPEISRFDPVAVAIGLRPGQLCEIMRPSKTAVWSRYYRICV
jgi:DNA-directed RNA polymerase subunit H (RpoH/RPB5)